MENKIKIIVTKKAPSEDVFRFQKKARNIYQTQVKTQVQIAQSTKLAKKVFVCNNPV